MITEKDIKTRLSEILTDNGFNVVAEEIREGFDKPAVFVTVFPASAEKLSSGGATEQITDSVEIKYIPADETVEACIDAANTMKRLFYYSTFDIQDRHLTVEQIEFEIEKTILYVYFDISFIQLVETDEEYDTMQEFDIAIEGGNDNGLTQDNN